MNFNERVELAKEQKKAAKKKNLPKTLTRDDAQAWMKLIPIQFDDAARNSSKKRPKTADSTPATSEAPVLEEMSKEVVAPHRPQSSYTDISCQPIMPPKRKNESGKTGKEASSSKHQKSGGSTVLYLVRAEEYEEYRENEGHTIGIYSSKKLALENARIAFEEQFSGGFFQNGKFSEPDLFEVTQDNSKTVTGAEGSNVIYEQCDQEGDGSKITLEKINVDKPYQSK